MSCYPWTPNRGGRWLAATLLLCALPYTSGAATPASGTLTGYVSNAQTSNLLEGARADVPSLGLSALTDNTGRHMLLGVRAGAHQLIASYTGLDRISATVNVSAGQVATRNFDLTSSIYQLEAFTVTGEREGNAAAITAQRNAPGKTPPAGRPTSGIFGRRTTTTSASNRALIQSSTTGSPTRSGQASRSTSATSSTSAKPFTAATRIGSRARSFRGPRSPLA